MARWARNSFFPIRSCMGKTPCFCSVAVLIIYPRSMREVAIGR